MKRENYISKNNFNFSNKFNKRENSMKLFDKYIYTPIKEDDEQVTDLFADHEQRMMMDGLKNMLEAMIEGRYGIAERYSRLDPELGTLYKKYLSFDHVALLKERICTPGYAPDSALEEEVQKVLDLY